MKFLVVLLVIVVVAFIAFLVWATQDEQRTCARWTNVVVAVGHNDPEDLHGVLEMYGEDCGS